MDNLFIETEFILLLSNKLQSKFPNHRQVCRNMSGSGSASIFFESNI